MTITKTPFGTTRDHQPVEEYILTNDAGAMVSILDYGCTVRQIVVPDADGKPVDVCLGYNTQAEYEQNSGYLGAVVGRCANRIAKGHFVLNGKDYRLAINDAPNHLHGGVRGFDKQMWRCEPLSDRLRFTRISPDSEEGYPGNLKTTVEYRLTEDNALIIHYDAVCDADTVLNMTNHTYFNLSGEGSGDILAHTLQIDASAFAANDAHCLPTGEILPVEDTPFDFRTPMAIGSRIMQDDSQLHNGKGYDHNFVLNTVNQMDKPVATLCSPASKIMMRVYTSKPGIQLYTGNVLGEVMGKSGKQYGKHHGLCLETQFSPNAMSCPHFPSVILRQNEHYSHTTMYHFSCPMQ